MSEQLSPPQGLLEELELKKQDPINYLDRLNQAFLAGELKDKKVAQKVREGGYDGNIWRTTYDLLLTNHDVQNKEAMQILLRDAEILGIDKDKRFPQTREVLSKFKKIYGIQPEPPPDPSRRRFIGNSTATIATAAVASVPAIALLNAATRVLESSRHPESPTVFDEFIKPLKEEARRRRIERARSDPNYYHMIDRELNEDKNGDPIRINVLLFGIGTLLTPGNPPAINGANQIISINLKDRTVDLISITSETRDPNAERHLKKTKDKDAILSINSSYDIGGFDLMRESFAKSTGLEMDFQVFLADGAVKDFVEQVLGGELDVDLPYDLATYKVDVDGKEYPDKEFKAGRQPLDGVRVLQFMKGETINKWEKGKLPHNRKNIIMDAVTQAIKRNVLSLRFLPDFLKSQMSVGRIQPDFDLNKVVDWGALSKIGFKPLGFDELRTGQQVTMMNPDMGGEGVRYVGEDRQYNPITAADIAANIYPNHYEGVPGADWWSGVVIPYNGNPHAEDLVTDYWGETRRVVKKRLLPS